MTAPQRNLLHHCELPQQSQTWLHASELTQRCQEPFFTTDVSDTLIMCQRGVRHRARSIKWHIVPSTAPGAVQDNHAPRCVADRVVGRIGGRAEGDAIEAWDVPLNRSVVAKCYHEVRFLFALKLHIFHIISLIAAPLFIDQGKTVEYEKELGALRTLITSPVYENVYGPFLDYFTEGRRQCIIQPFLGADLEAVM